MPGEDTVEVGESTNFVHWNKDDLFIYYLFFIYFLFIIYLFFIYFLFIY